MQKKIITSLVLLSTFLGCMTAQTWSVDSLPAPFLYGSAAVSSKIVMIGGETVTGNFVHIYDDATKIWTRDSLSFRTLNTQMVPIGNKLYCFQGLNPTMTSEYTNYLDIYNATTNTWQRDSMPFVPNSVGSGAIGGKLFIAGGLDNNSVVNTVRIYDTLTKRWSYTASLSVARQNVTVVRVKNKLLFIGGSSSSSSAAYRWLPHKNIDIYDETTGVWSTVFMKTARANPSVTVSDGKVLIVGGIIRLGDAPGAFLAFYRTKSVETYDVDTNTWLTADFTQPRVAQGVTYDKKAYFICGATQDETTSYTTLYNKMDVYDFTTNTWASSLFPFADFVRMNASSAGLKNKIFFMGGSLANFTYTKRIDILTLPLSNIFETNVLQNKLSVFPNPATDELTIDFDKKEEKEYALKVTNALGQVVFNQQNIDVNPIKIPLKNVHQGVYFLTITTPKGVKSQSFVKQ